MLCLMGIIISIIQVSLICYYTNIGGVYPNIVLVKLIIISLLSTKRVYIYGFIMGIIIDLYNRNFGLNTLVYTLLGYIVGKIAYKFYKGIVFLMLILFLSSMCHQIIIHSVQRELSIYFIVRYIIPGSIYTTIVGVIIYYILILRRCIK